MSEWDRIGREARLRVVDEVGPPPGRDEADNARAAAVGKLAPASLLPFVDASSFEGLPVPVLDWQLKGWEPRRSCVLVTGLGASGKSLLYQQRMTCSAAGVPFLGIDVTPGISIYLTCEDDLAELHRRQDSINAALGITWSDLRGRLFLISLKGEPNNELCTFDGSGRMSPSERWQQLRETIRTVGATHVTIDNVAHVFSGSEIVRNHVAAFVGLLDRLATEIDGGVILLGHPNKEGAEYSGSTAWENQVRSRIYLSLEKADSEGISDPDGRLLTNSKPNYARRGQSISFIWHEWAFRLRDDLPPNRAAEMAATTQASGENARFLECLEKATGERRSTSVSRSAPTYAPRLFARMTTARGMTVASFERAMERLLHLGTIRADMPLWKRENRAWVHGIGLARDVAPDPALNVCTEPHVTPTESGGNPCTAEHLHVSLPPKGGNGAPLGAAAPYPKPGDPK